jgi:hypothetical protein
MKNSKYKSSDITGRLKQVLRWYKSMTEWVDTGLKRLIKSHKGKIIFQRKPLQIKNTPAPARATDGNGEVGISPFCVRR